MEHYPYKHAAILETESAAKALQKQLQNETEKEIKIFCISPDPEHSISEKMEHKLEPETREIQHTIVRDAIYGATGGAFVGGMTAFVSGALNLALFATHPVIATLAVLGYGSALGATGGMIVGVKPKEDLFVAVLEDALIRGHWVVITHSADRQTDQKISLLMKDTPGIENLLEN